MLRIRRTSAPAELAPITDPQGTSNWHAQKQDIAGIITGHRSYRTCSLFGIRCFSSHSRRSIIRRRASAPNTRPTMFFVVRSLILLSLQTSMYCMKKSWRINFSFLATGARKIKKESRGVVIHAIVRRVRSTCSDNKTTCLYYCYLRLKQSPNRKATPRSWYRGIGIGIGILRRYDTCTYNNTRTPYIIAPVLHERRCGNLTTTNVNFHDESVEPPFVFCFTRARSLGKMRI